MRGDRRIAARSLDVTYLVAQIYWNLEERFAYEACRTLFVVDSKGKTK